MIELNLSNADLFQNLMDLDLNGQSLDIHNDYNCSKILLNGKKNTLCLLLESIRKDAHPRFINIFFEDVILRDCVFSFETIITTLTIDNFYRGRFEENGILQETDGERNFFYIEFYEGTSFELLARKVILSVGDIQF